MTGFFSVRKNQRYAIVSSLLIETELSSLMQSTIVPRSCLPTANILFKLVLPLSKNCGQSQKHFQ